MSCTLKNLISHLFAVCVFHPFSWERFPFVVDLTFDIATVLPRRRHIWIDGLMELDGKACISMAMSRRSRWTNGHGQTDSWEYTSSSSVR